MRGGAGESGGGTRFLGRVFHFGEAKKLWEWTV